MTAQRLNRLHTENLCHLIQLRDAIAHDPLEACLAYGIDRATAQRYADASDEQLRELAFSVEESLFVPRLRGDLLASMLAAPPELRGITAAVYHEGARPHGHGLRPPTNTRARDADKN